MDGEDVKLGHLSVDGTPGEERAPEITAGQADASYADYCRVARGEGE